MAKIFYIGSTRVFNDNVPGQLAQGLGPGDNVEFEDITCNDLSTSDLIMSNDKPNRSGNEVDGTKGSWVIQEGENDLFLLNRRNGKKYKFNLTDV